MIFSSLEFLCVFLPVVYISYWIVPSLKAKNGLLVAASLVFYAYGEPIYVVLMLLSAAFNYVSAYGIAQVGKRKKWILAISIIVNLGVLVFFKYTAFLIHSINAVIGTEIAAPEISLPVGISFFTFQALSYVIDVYRGRVAANKSFFKVLLYICFFPQLIAGPIVKYQDICDAIEERNVTAVQASEGLLRFICGLSKKVLIANACGCVSDQVFAADTSQVNIIVAWIGALSYLMQIYYDFSGYSDMAIGLGKMFGFYFKEKFRYPYAAASVQEFWQRWHISLSSWFKDYVYIPLGGNRKGKGRTVLNRWIVFFLTGLWHGANWTFILWGLYHGAFLMVEECIPVVRKLPRFILHIYTVLVVSVGFVMFRADTVSQGCFLIKRMFGGFFLTAESVSFAWRQMTPYFIVMFVAAVLGCGPVRPFVKRIQERFLEKDDAGGNVCRGVLMMGSVLLLAWCMIRLSGSTYNPFIYFRF